MERRATASCAPGAGCARPGEGAGTAMASPTYGIDAVALALAVLLAVAIAFLISQIIPACRPDDAAALDRHGKLIG